MSDRVSERRPRGGALAGRRQCALSDAASNGSRGLCTGGMRRRDCAGPVVASAAAYFPFFARPITLEVRCQF
jgi:hypothetical protein